MKTNQVVRERNAREMGILCVFISSTAPPSDCFILPEAKGQAAGIARTEQPSPLSYRNRCGGLFAGPAFDSQSRLKLAQTLETQRFGIRQAVMLCSPEACIGNTRTLCGSQPTQSLPASFAHVGKRIIVHTCACPIAGCSSLFGREAEFGLGLVGIWTKLRPSAQRYFTIP